MKKKIILFFLNFILLILVTGCWNYTEMEEQLVVAGFAVDQGEGEVPFLVTAEIIMPAIGETKIVQGEGYTILDALRNISATAGKKLYVGHCKSVIICSSVAEQGIYSVVDILARDHELRLSANVVVCKFSPAWQFYERESIDPIKSYEIDKTIADNPKALSKTLPVNIANLIETMNTEGISLMLPVIEKIYSANKPVYKIGGAAVFNDDKLIGFLTPEETKFVLMVRNELKGGVLLVKQENNDTLKNKEMSTGFEIFKNTTKLKYKGMNDGTIKILVKTKTEVALSDHDPENTLKLHRDNDLSKNLERSIEDSIEYVFTNAQKELGVDIFGIGNHLYKYNYKVWKQVKKDWNEYYKKVEIDVEATVEIKHSGLTREVIKVGEK